MRGGPLLVWCKPCQPAAMPPVCGQAPTQALPLLRGCCRCGCRLYRDSTQYVNGKHVRDLSKLNRDLGKVLFITADKDAYALQPENAIKVGTL